jgi:hypothetical protein
MQLDTLVLPEEDAAARLAEYEKAIKLDRNEEDVAIAAGYRAAKRGLPVIMLSQVMAAGGFHDNGLPKLAVARASATECWVRVEGWGSDPVRNLVFSDTEWTRNRGTLVASRSVRINNIPIEPPNGRIRTAGRTVVPLVPPAHRPKRGRISSFHVLWEVDEWTPAPPVDPALIRHIRGDLWSVVAVWDLTPLERAVLSARTRSLT